MGNPDVVFETLAGDIVLDHRVSAARPARDEFHDRLDLQLLALVHGWKESTGRRVVGWRWQHLLKLKSPALFDIEVPIRPEERGPNPRRLAQVVNLSIRMLKAVLDGGLEPPPRRRRCGCASALGTGRVARCPKTPQGWTARCDWLLTFEAGSPPRAHRPLLCLEQASGGVA